MSVSKWAWIPECDNRVCCGDCYECSAYDEECEECEVKEKMTEQEIQTIMLKMGDDRMVSELDIGCNNHFDQGYARCPYNKSRCERGAFLTSTLLGAHPNDCPLRRKNK